MQVLESLVALPNAAARRQTMVDCQIRTFDVTDQRVIARFLDVPREHFVPDEMRDLAYSDVGLTLRDDPAHPRYLLAPLILARLLQNARITSRDRILDVAGGLGYSAAIIAGLGAEVIALEETPEMRVAMARRLAGHASGNVRTLDGDLAEGAREDGPFDVILINGAIETNTGTLAAQLAEGGRMLCIKRDPGDPTGRAAKALCFEKRNGELGSQFLFDSSAPVLAAFRSPAAFHF